MTLLMIVITSVVLRMIMIMILNVQRYTPFFGGGGHPGSLSARTVKSTSCVGVGAYGKPYKP